MSTILDQEEEQVLAEATEGGSAPEAGKKTRKPREKKPITGYTIRKAFDAFNELCRQGRNAGLEITWLDQDGNPLPVQPAGMKIRGYSEY
jgi:hypothetical protein